MLLVLAAVTLSAHTVLPTAFPEVVAQSTMIVRGRVTDVRVAKDPDSGVESIATVAVDHVLKGGSSPFVSVHVPGGLVGRTRVVVSGAPTLRAGDEAVFFLKRIRRQRLASDRPVDGDLPRPRGPEDRAAGHQSAPGRR